MVADVIGLDGLISIKEYLTITMNAAVRKNRRLLWYLCDDAFCELC